MSPHSTGKNWRSPEERRLSLWSDAQRQLSEEISAELKQASNERQAQIKRHLTEALEIGIAKLPADVQAKADIIPRCRFESHSQEPHSRADCDPEKVLRTRRLHRHTQSALPRSLPEGVEGVQTNVSQKSKHGDPKRISFGRSLRSPAKFL